MIIRPGKTVGPLAAFSKLGPQDNDNPSIKALKIIDKFSSISSYKINLTKSALLLLKTLIEDSISNYGIPIVSHFIYIGIDILPETKLLPETLTERSNQFNTTSVDGLISQLL